MNSNSTEFPITVVSTDTTALREISWTLSSFGYHVATSSDWSEKAPWRKSIRPSLVLLDARNEQEIEHTLSSPRATPYTYRVALYDRNSSSDADSLLDLGADDLVCYPVNIGELLSCLRRGERRLEFERRLNVTTTFDLHAGIANKRGFIRQLERQQRDDRGPIDNSLIIVAIDFLPTIHAQYGYLAVEEANANLAQLLHDELSSEDFRGILHEGVHAVLLQGRTVSEGILFAKAISKKISHQRDAADTKRPQLSVSGVVLKWPSSNNAENAIKQALVAFGYMSGLGGNVIQDVETIEQQYDAWKQQFNFRYQIDAQQIMETLPLVLPLNAMNPIHRNGLGIFALTSGQSIPPCIPVVDDSGQLLGVVEAKAFRLHGTDVFNSLEAHLEAISDTVKSNTSLDEIATALDNAERDYLLVVENKKPIGYITNQTLSAINVNSIEAIDDDKLFHEDYGLSSLVVPLS